MKLGTFAFITFYSPRTEQTKTFCSLLGFSAVPDGGPLLVTDGNVYFDLRQGEKTATMLSYCVADVENAAAMAENLQIDIIERSTHHAILREPNGLMILLAGPHIMTLKEFPKHPVSLCGTFYELSLETEEMEKSIAWWQNVGFKVTTRKKTWCTLDDGKMMIGLYEKGSTPHLFRNPSLTYFEPDMGNRIAELKKRGVTFVQEEKDIGMEGHAVAKSPDGQFFFLFKA